ncbi:hypothetical protein E8E13_008200 [Curvularia kusanoi]|uniref:Uncharacterized protein n=1 Tax=Curvularia kusanoi TaxID=90978 RepID=A0A9P4WCY7_CURKU|nr:hypothetical protein E8E13_008200 [Curvularia kusanoi]
MTLNGPYTPPKSCFATSSPYSPSSTNITVQPGTLFSPVWEPPTPTPTRFSASASAPAAPPPQADHSIHPSASRLQQDLLLLTSFNDNSTLHWRPSWFPQTGATWTLHNPPNVVTERLPTTQRGLQLYTRRMRRPEDPEPLYIKTRAHWERYCALYSVPEEFLCEEQVRAMRVGLERDEEGGVCAPPSYPLYPEPPLEGRYALSAGVCATHLPRRFKGVGCGDGQVVVVEVGGELSVEDEDDDSMCPAESVAYRWSYVPWTEAMEDSCRPLTVKLRLWNAGRQVE